MSEPTDLFPGFKVPPNDPSREIIPRPAFTVAAQMPDDDDDRGCDDSADYTPCGECEDGMIVTCIDDLCRGAGWCMHGDGERICPRCNGL